MSIPVAGDLGMNELEPTADKMNIELSMEGNVDIKILPILEEHWGLPIKVKPVHRHLYLAGMKKIVERVEPYMQNMGGRDSKPQMWIMMSERDWQSIRKAVGLE